MDTFFGCFHLQKCCHDLYQQIVSHWEHNTNTANTLLPDVLRGIELVTNAAVSGLRYNWQQGGHPYIFKYQHAMKVFFCRSGQWH